MIPIRKLGRGRAPLSQVLADMLWSWIPAPGGSWKGGLQGRKEVGTIGRFCLDVEIGGSHTKSLSHGRSSVHCLGTTFGPILL